MHLIDRRIGSSGKRLMDLLLLLIEHLQGERELAELSVRISKTI